MPARRPKQLSTGKMMGLFLKELGKKVETDILEKMDSVKDWTAEAINHPKDAVRQVGSALLENAKSNVGV